MNSLGTIKDWNSTSNTWVFNGGKTCGGTPRQGTITMKCATSNSGSVSEKTLYASSGAVACNNCCNYNLVYNTPKAC